ncbi:MAG: acyltransferase [Solirubrobacterales bacterium]
MNGGGQADVETGMPKRVPALDGIRALAMFGIVTVHLLGASGVFGRYEGTGTDVVLWSILGNTIDVFFIISGFVLFLPAVRRGGDLGDKWAFWVGRGARLLPALWLVLAITLVLTVVKPPTPDAIFPPFTEILANATGQQMPAALLLDGFRIGFGMDGPLWIISIVVTFYALLPFVARSWFRHPWIWLAIAATVTVAWKEAVNQAPGLFEAVSNNPPTVVRELSIDQFPAWAFSFGLGMTGACAYVTAHRRWGSDRLRRAATIAMPFVFVAYGVVAWRFGVVSESVPGNIGPEARAETLHGVAHSALRAAVIGVIILGPLWLQRPFGNRAARKTSELSYGVYLIHWLIVVYVFAYLDMPEDGTLSAFAIWVAVILPPSFLYAAVTRRWIELPARRRIEGRCKRSPLAAAGRGPERPPGSAEVPLNAEGTP